MNTRSLMLYDFLLVKGGAESLTLTLCNAVNDMDLCVGFVDRSCFTEQAIIPGSITELTTLTKVLGWQSIKVASAFERKKARLVSGYEKVIFSGSNAPLAVKYRSQGGNLLYCHTPPRFVYDLKSHYLTSIALWQRPLLKILIAYMQPKYEAAIEKMDVIIANSVNVQQRIKRYLNKDAIVIYPPCHVDQYHWISQGDYYLSTARVESFKRIKLIVEAFMQMPDKQLVVASGGSQLAQLQALASGYDNIRFTGWCESKQLQDLMGNCIATLYLPIDEDFGISPVESMAAGKPVIGVDEGGVRETVIAGETGLLCPPDPVTTDIIKAVKQMSPEYALSLKAHCQQRAGLFSSEIFINKMESLLNCPVSSLASLSKKLCATAQP